MDKIRFEYPCPKCGAVSLSPGCSICAVVNSVLADEYKPTVYGNWEVIGLYKHRAGKSDERDLYVVRHMPSGIVMIVYSRFLEFTAQVEEGKI